MAADIQTIIQKSMGLSEEQLKSLMESPSPQRDLSVAEVLVKKEYSSAEELGGYLCKEMGLDWKQAYIAMLDDLNVKQIRVPIYWDEIEPRYQEYNFSDYDFIFDDEFLVEWGEILISPEEMIIPVITMQSKV
jgi:hypothetical protein